MTKPFPCISGGCAILLTVGAFILFTPVGATFLARPIAAASLTWEAVQPEVMVGKAVRLEVRLTGDAANLVATPIAVTSSRLDMAPDGMAAMTAQLRPVASSRAGILAFDADLVMAGRWALTVAAQVEGQTQPVSGSVVFTATERLPDAAPERLPGGARKPVYYRNPMGLADISPQPKKDSMGMDYIPVYAEELSGPSGTVRIAPERVQRAGVRTEVVMLRHLVRSIRAVGTIVPDESRVAIVTAKFDGFIEHLFVPLTGADVRAGQPLARVWIESREILQKQADYLTALRTGAARLGDVERAEQNLRLFSISEQEIAQLRRSGQALRTIVMTAPTNGTVLEKPAIVGMRFAAGDMLFRTADLSTVWAMTQVAERDLAWIRPGQPARLVMKAYPDTTVEGTVAFVYPEIDMATRTARVRIELPNRDGRLRGGLYADVTIEAQAGNGAVLAVPDSAIIDNGTKRIVFVDKGSGTFEPRALTVGQRGNGYAEVREGLAEGERIVVTGNFLIDSESNLRAALASFVAPEAVQ